MPIHDLPGRTRPALLAATLAATTLLGVGIGISRPDAADAATSLKTLAAAKGRDVGFALAVDRITEPAYPAVADNEFNLVVAENAMKWDSVEPVQGQFRWTGSDVVADYATATGKKLYGHTLLWHQALPGWVAALPADQLRAAMRHHITTVVDKYEGRVAAWDVVNEAFSDNGDGSRRGDSVFQQKLGDGYIAEALTTARAADPDVDLCLNDYSVEWVGAKSDALYNLVKSFKATGVPIDCVGLQGHFVLGQVPGDLQANLQRFADLGVDVRITELDVRVPVPADATKLAQQASDYRRVWQACLAVTRCRGVTTWGLTDRYSWIPEFFAGQGAALMFDENYAPKPAYQAVAEALGGAPTPSPTTPTPSPTTPAPGVGCTVTYVPNSWNTGFTAEVRIRNDGPTAITGWSVGFAFSTGQAVTNGWNATVSQAGAQVTARNAAWNATVPAGGTVSFGFQGTHGGVNPSPAAFTLNGSACRAG
ncbi:endo-1,4-beta-xylanase [Micromonospora phytophila]|uniref:endo-1,4-beta-xylanase n=1 Tax=Micromonospora phytophila TaxID=709888 RepID=UPI00202EEE5B|nr:endo-1,4-beta-xylanase [Micromonospora phytophila]MCM0678057.1 endo-1,4-beta-xylanase [Micromonospora phytophila]